MGEFVGVSSWGVARDTLPQAGSGAHSWCLGKASGVGEIDRMDGMDRIAEGGGEW